MNKYTEDLPYVKPDWQPYGITLADIESSDGLAAPDKVTALRILGLLQYHATAKQEGICPESYESTVYGSTDVAWAILKDIDGLLEWSHGIAGIPVNTYYIADYLNAGDTYDTTLVYDRTEDTFCITSWGSFYEGYCQDNDTESCCLCGEYFTTSEGLPCSGPGFDVRSACPDCACPYIKAEIEQEYDWDGLRKDCLENIYKDDCGETRAETFLGTVFQVMPSGKYWTDFACGNVDEHEQYLDIVYRELLEEVLEDNGMYLINSDGDPCDLLVGLVNPEEWAEESEETED